MSELCAVSELCHITERGCCGATTLSHETEPMDSTHTGDKISIQQRCSKEAAADNALPPSPVLGWPRRGGGTRPVGHSP
jgi:hypothetical protein